MGQAGDQAAADTTFGSHKRLLTAAEYSRVFDTATARASHQHLLLLASPNGLTQSRLGLVIAKKNVRKAVSRNRIKRIAREMFRMQTDTERTIDVVLLARRGLDQLDKQELAVLLRQQWRKLCLKVS